MLLKNDEPAKQQQVLRKIAKILLERAANHEGKMFQWLLMMNGSQAPEHAALEVADGHCHNSRASGAELPAVSQALHPAHCQKWFLDKNYHSIAKQGSNYKTNFIP